MIRWLTRTMAGAIHAACVIGVVMFVADHAGAFTSREGVQSLGQDSLQQAQQWGTTWGQQSTDWLSAHAAQAPQTTMDWARQAAQQAPTTLGRASEAVDDVRGRLEATRAIWMAPSPAWGALPSVDPSAWSQWMPPSSPAANLPAVPLQTSIRP